MSIIKIDNNRVEEAKQILGEQGAYIIADELNIESWNDNTLCGKSIFKDENTPSMKWNKEKNNFHCFATGNNYDIVDHFMKHYNKTFIEAVKMLYDKVGFEYSENEFKDSSNEESLKGFKFAKDEPQNDRKIVEAYLLKRGISPQTLDFCNVKQNAKGDIAYQTYDVNGKLIQTKYRVSKPSTNKEHKWYWQVGASCCNMLYGVNKVSFDKPLVICEGQNDRLAIVESGWTNVVSVPNGAGSLDWINFNYELLERIPSIIIWADDDEAGQKMTEQCVHRLGIAKTKVVNIPQEVKQSMIEVFKGKIEKVDANNILASLGKETVLKLINNAEEIPNPLVKRLMDYEEVEIEDLPKISTGFKGLDRIVSGNLTGSLTVLTGRTGQGKSTLINTFGIIAPVESGEKVFIYSGEFNGGMLLGNLMRPIAGVNHIIEFDHSQDNRPNWYGVTNDAKNEIKRYYRDKIFNYEDSNDMNTDATKILESIEYSYRRYGVTNFTIDNLMCISFKCSEDDKYQAQTDFVKALKRLTRKFPIRIILVCHPRKSGTNQSDDVNSSDISGSADIVNLANRAYSIRILKQDDSKNPEGYNTEITVLKDRETGKTGSSVKMFYDYTTGRIYLDEEERTRKYLWEQQSDIVYSKDMDSKLVYHKKPTQYSVPSDDMPHGGAIDD